VKANLRVAYDVVTPTHRMRPAVIGIPLELESDGAITLLANLITVTPGTLTLDISPDRRTLYIHAMYMDDEATLRAEIKALEQKIRELVS
jgi:multicomponent Na+:H+ antiporter subunit E